jgi:hypothetical protein
MELVSVRISDRPVAGRSVIIELFYLLLCPYYRINNVKELLIVGYVKYHYPEMKSSSRRSQYEFKIGRSDFFRSVPSLIAAIKERDD